MKANSSFMWGALFGGLAVGLFVLPFVGIDHLGQKGGADQSLASNDINSELLSATQNVGAELREPLDVSGSAPKVKMKDNEIVACSIDKPGETTLSETVDPVSDDPEAQAALEEQRKFIANYPRVAADAEQQIEVIVSQAMERGVWLATDNDALRPHSIFITPQVFQRVLTPLLEMVNSGAMKTAAPVEI